MIESEREILRKKRERKVKARKCRRTKILLFCFDYFFSANIKQGLRRAHKAAKELEEKLKGHSHNKKLNGNRMKKILVRFRRTKKISICLGIVCGGRQAYNQYQASAPSCKLVVCYRCLVADSLRLLISGVRKIEKIRGREKEIDKK